MTVGLVCIVKNEARILPRLAESLRGQISHATVIDTGSDDNTIEVARTCFDVPVTLRTLTWSGFAAARNFALETAEPFTDWMLMLDADDTIVGTVEIPSWAAGSYDALNVEERYFNLSYWLPRLINSKAGARYKGRAHEYLVCEHEIAQTDSFYIHHNADGSNRANKFERDTSLLLKDWEEERDPRSAFYLAHSYDGIGDWSQAIHWYRTRLSLPGWDEESFFTTYRLGACLLASGAPAEGTGFLWKAWGMRSHRPEPLLSLAEHYRLTEQWNLAWLASHEARYGVSVRGTPSDLFVDTQADWKLDYEASIAAWYVNRRTEGQEYIESLLTMELPEPWQSSVRSNATFYLNESAG